MLFLAYFLALLYTLFLLWIFRGARQWSARTSSVKHEPLVSVVVAARNEGSRIHACLDHLLRQTYSQERLEIIVVDDASNDRTPDIVRSFAEQCPRVHLIQVGSGERGKAPKKSALQKGISHSRGEIIFVTDADCLVSPQWIERMLDCFEPETGIVFGWVGLRPAHGLFGPVQQIEYVSLIAMAAGFAGVGHPTMCNANSLAFRRKAFDEVNGYAGIDTVLSGDDELLMQKIADRTHWKAAFCDRPQALNQTTPCSGVLSFLNQRMRWGSKGLVYRRTWLRAMLAGIYGFYLSFWVLFFSSLIKPDLWVHFAVLFAIKCVADIPLVSWTLCRIERPGLLRWLFLAELFQIFYVPVVSTAGTFGLYRWKPAAQEDAARLDDALPKAEPLGK